MTHTELKDLLEKAKAATPGPWSFDLDEEEIHADTVSSSDGDPYHIAKHDGTFIRENGEFIAAANPKTITHLITRLLEAEKVIEFYAEVDCFQELDENSTNVKFGYRAYQHFQKYPMGKE